MSQVLRIANVSGFYGDRVSAAAEMVQGGPIDVLTGDWLAELTMLILARSRMKHGPGSGYARTFVTQMEQVLGPVLDREIKVVSNAGGLDPNGLADAVRDLAERLGLTPVIAVVTGDDLLPRIDELRGAGELFANLDTDETFGDLAVPALTANAYLGGFGIKAALDAGADIVVTGRVTDAALVVGPAAWRFAWSPDDVDELAGAIVAGHVIECGTQATGGNYAFFQEVPGMVRLGFPIAEIAADGSSVITKHPGPRGLGGEVTGGTVTAQLLYEIDSAAYPNPDATADFGSIRLRDDGDDRVAIEGVRGLPPPDRLKVALNYLGGFRNAVTFVLTGLDVEAKAGLVTEQLFAAIPGGRDVYDAVDVKLLRHHAGAGEPQDLWQAQSDLRITVRSRDPNLVGKAFTAPAIELTLASVPGLFATGQPGPGSPFGVYWPTTVGAALTQVVCVDGDQVAEVPGVSPAALPWQPPLPDLSSSRSEPEADPGREADTVHLPWGRLVGARSGDKGGNANIGVWVRDGLPDVDVAFEWLKATLTPWELQRLLPECAGLVVDRYDLPNLRAVNFVVRGLLGRGVAENVFLDPQGKGLGEYLRAKSVHAPRSLLNEAPP
jgi:hypothetical protein